MKVLVAEVGLDVAGAGLTGGPGRGSRGGPGRGSRGGRGGAHGGAGTGLTAAARAGFSGGAVAGLDGGAEGARPVVISRYDGLLDRRFRRHRRVASRIVPTPTLLMVTAFTGLDNLRWNALARLGDNIADDRHRDGHGLQRPANESVPRVAT